MVSTRFYVFFGGFRVWSLGVWGFRALVVLFGIYTGLSIYYQGVWWPLALSGITGFGVGGEF